MATPAVVRKVKEKEVEQEMNRQLLQYLKGKKLKFVDADAREAMDTVNKNPFKPAPMSLTTRRICAERQYQSLLGVVPKAKARRFIESKWKIKL